MSKESKNKQRKSGGIPEPRTTEPQSSHTGVFILRISDYLYFYLFIFFAPTFLSW